MKIAEVAHAVQLSETALDHASAVLGISASAHVTKEDLSRVADYLKVHYGYSKDSLDPLRDLEPGFAPLTYASASMSSGGSGGFNASFLLSRGNMKGVQLQRKTRNCGDTAGLVLEGLAAIASVQREMDVARQTFVQKLKSVPVEHEVWDITVHQHTFTLERHPKRARSLLIQSYQPGYNVQFWCGLDNPFLDSEHQNLEDLPQRWRRPSRNDEIVLAGLINELMTAEKGGREAIWKSLPFNPNDAGRPLLDAETLILTANRITFAEETDHEATLRGLLYSMRELS